MRSSCLPLKLAWSSKGKCLWIALCWIVSMRLAQKTSIEHNNLPPVCSFLSFLSLLDLRCGLWTWSSMFACCVFTNFEEPSTKLAWPVASTSKNLENLSDKQSRYWRQLIDKIHKTSSRLGSHAPQFVLEPHVAHINHPQLQDLVHSQ